ncbi:SDR family oxidoreductase [Microlunatus flavus]|uniref:Short-chain dehydrogenase n=1 Tax=Microlunatus flavus TaxID=1036181 RepID=A0A1H9AFN3_9ACTN|nr:SDR family oxidoreductase [Microlunatus flavus]SEP75536.1 Short-chain dehydrogenase [Microlunatus flavus]
MTTTSTSPSTPGLLAGATVLVTGANGGLGREFVAQVLERGAVKVYASARSPQAWDDPRVVPLPLDVTDAESVARAAATAADTTVVVNNAGVTAAAPIATGEMQVLRDVFETNFFGAVAVAQAFAPVLAAHGGGALLNVQSVLSWVGLAGAYSASKAAFWSAGNSLRLELAPQGTQVTNLHFGYTDTPMASQVDAPKNDPADVVRAALDGLEAGRFEVLADQVAADVKGRLSAPVEEQYPGLAA